MSERERTLELLRIRDIIIKDPLALRNWAQITARLLNSPTDTIKINALIRTDFAEGVLKTLQMWSASRPAGFSFPDFIVLLRSLGLKRVTDALQVAHVDQRVKYSTTRIPVWQVVDTAAIVDVCRLLANDSLVMKELNLLAAALGVPRVEYCLWNTQRTTGNISTSELVTRVLEEWVGRTGNEATVEALTEHLTDMQFQNAADAIAEKFSGKCRLSSEVSTTFAQGRGRAIRFEVQPPSPDFMGRAEQLQELHDFLQSDDRFVLVVTGYGGEGKSELVKKFLEEIDDHEHTSITWFEGSDNFKLSGSLTSLAQSFGRKANKYKDLDELVKAVAHKLSAVTQNWLAVIDNVEEPYEELNQVATLLQSARAKVIVTSKWKTTLARCPSRIALPSLLEKDAVALVKKLQSNPVEDDAAIRCLLKALGEYALAITQAIAHINMERLEGDSDYGIKDYLHVFRRNTEEGLTQELQLSEYEGTMVGIVQTSLAFLEEKKGHLPQDALCLLSLMNPARIDIKFLQRIGMPDWKNDEAMEMALRPAKILCMIERKSGCVSMHSLVHKITRHLLRGKQERIMPIIRHNFKSLRLDEAAQQPEDVMHLAWIWNRSEVLRDLDPFDVHNAVIMQSVEKLIGKLMEGEYHEVLEEPGQQLASGDPEVERMSRSFARMFKEACEKNSREEMQGAVVSGFVDMFESNSGDEGASGLLRRICTNSKVEGDEEAVERLRDAVRANEETEGRRWQDMARDAAIFAETGNAPEAAQCLKSLMEQEGLNEEQQLDIVRMVEAFAVPFGYTPTLPPKEPRPSNPSSVLQLLMHEDVE